MAREIPYIQAIGEAVHQEMARDETVIYFGQNLALTEDDPYVKAFGGDRVRVTPISETAEIGMAVGAAFAGFRPVVQLYMAEFMLVAMDQVVNEAPRFYGMSGGEVKVPLVLQAGYGFTAGWAGQHTGTIYGMFMGVPGLKVVVPSTPADAKGLMTASIRDDNPVVFFHNYLLTLEHGDVPEGEHVVPLGEAVVRRGLGRHDRRHRLDGRQGARGGGAARRDGIEAEVIDPRTLAPLDVATIVQSVEKTGRLVVVDQATRHASAAAVIAAEVASEGFSALKAPIGLVTALDATIPYSQPMEEYLLPSESGSSPRCSRRSAPRPSPPERGRTPTEELGAGLGLELLGMWRIRVFEERVGQLTRADEVHGLVHLSVGQEAVAVGVCAGSPTTTPSTRTTAPTGTRSRRARRSDASWRS